MGNWLRKIQAECRINLGTKQQGREKATNGKDGKKMDFFESEHGFELSLIKSFCFFSTLQFHKSPLLVFAATIIVLIDSRTISEWNCRIVP